MSDSELPDKPSQLIRHAILDLKLIPELPNGDDYEIDMHEWHTPIYDTFSERPHGCLVCFAGAVMARTLGVSFDEFTTPERFDAATTRKLNALDDFRWGQIDYGLARMEIPHPPELPKRMGVIPHNPTNPEYFYHDMEAIAAELEKHNL